MAQGAQAVTGGKVADLGAGNHFEPTVLVNCRQDMDIVQKETFGPVLPVVTFSDLDEAIAFANDTVYGLTSSIYTNDIKTALRACNELHFGETYVNRENFEAMQGFHAGHGRSGIGGADGKHGLSSTRRPTWPTSRSDPSRTGPAVARRPARIAWRKALWPIVSTSAARSPW